MTNDRDVDVLFVHEEKRTRARTNHAPWKGEICKKKQVKLKYYKYEIPLAASQIQLTNFHGSLLTLVTNFSTEMLYLVRLYSRSDLLFILSKIQIATAITIKHDYYHFLDVSSKKPLGVLKFQLTKKKQITPRRELSNMFPK